jgi:hypothetical protein
MQRRGASSRPPKRRRTNRARLVKRRLDAVLEERVAALTRELKEATRQLTTSAAAGKGLLAACVAAEAPVPAVV